MSNIHICWVAALMLLHVSVDMKRFWASGEKDIESGSLGTALYEMNVFGNAAEAFS